MAPSERWIWETSTQSCWVQVTIGQRVRSHPYKPVLRSCSQNTTPSPPFHQIFWATTPRIIRDGPLGSPPSIDMKNLNNDQSEDRGFQIPFGRLVAPYTANLTRSCFLAICMNESHSDHSKSRGSQLYSEGNLYRPCQLVWESLRIEDRSPS